MIQFLMIAFIIWLSCSRPAISQFAVHNVPYGPNFETQMLICSIDLFNSKKLFKESYHMSVKAEDLEVNFVLPNFNLCLFKLRTRLMKKLNRNLTKGEESTR